VVVAGTTMTRNPMIVEKDLRKLIHQLLKEEVANISLGNSEILVHVFDNATKISLASTVYFGGNYIPKSVRLCLSHKPSFETTEHIKTYHTLDEDNFKISLNYLGGLDHLNKRMFIDLLEEFSWLADEWRLHLDEHDKNDLVHVRQPK
jgi:hypothetical protein